MRVEEQKSPHTINQPESPHKPSTSLPSSQDTLEIRERGTLQDSQNPICVFCRAIYNFFVGKPATNSPEVKKPVPEKPTAAPQEIIKQEEPADDDEEPVVVREADLPENNAWVKWITSWFQKRKD